MKFPCIGILLGLTSIANGYKILFLAPLNGPSHWMFLQHIINELLNRGHELTCITSEKLSDSSNLANYSQILIDPALNVDQILPDERVFNSEYGNEIDSIHALVKIGYVSSDFGFQSANVQRFIHRNDLHFDLVINEEFFHDSWLMFAHKFNAPIITISTYGISDFFDRTMGLLTPWSNVPHMLLSYTDHMTFYERFYNTFLSIYDWIHRNWIYLPQQNKLAKKYFSHLELMGKALPSIEELQKNVSIILVNNHRSMSPPRPSMQGIIHIGGAHIKSPKPLPIDLQQFLDNSKYGVIYFSLGSFVKSSKMPKEKIAVFLETFRKLKQNVLWKFEDESLNDIPKNVMIRKWLPQTDILAHPNILLFISHGGLFGNFEGIARGVPMVFIPFYGDQYRNSIRATKYGYGKALNFHEISEEILTNILMEMIENESYRNKAKELSSIFKDNLVHPLDEALFWIEYVCRYRGAKHLKSHAINMSWFSYLLLDILLVIVFILFVFVALIYCSLKSIYAINNATNINRKKKQ